MGDKADLKNGYAKVANDLIEALSQTSLGQHESRVIWSVIRKTYGWNKKSDVLSASQIADLTGLERRHASRARRKLVDRLILVDNDGELAINTKVDEWVRGIPPGSHSGVPHGAQQGVPPEAHQQRTGCAPRGTVGVPPEAQGCAPRGTVSVPRGAHPPSQTNGEGNPAKGAKKRTSGKKKSTKGGVPRGAPQKTGNTGKTLKGGKTLKDSSTEGQKTTHRGNGKTPPPTAATWTAYATAYEERYGVEPIRNATVNSQLASFVKRIGADLAPLVAAYYVGLNTRYYVQKGHTTGPMLVDAEKLATECRTNTRITETGARQSDQSSERLGVFEQLLIEEQNRGK